MPPTLTLQVPLVGQPNATEDPKVASDITALQTWGAGINAMWATGTFAARPGAGSLGRLYYATDSPGTFYIDTGAAWVPVMIGTTWTALTFVASGLQDASGPPASLGTNTTGARVSGDWCELRGSIFNANLGGVDIAAGSTLFTVPFRPLRVQRIPVGGSTPSAPLYYSVDIVGNVTLNQIVSGGSGTPPSLTGLRFYLLT